MLDQAGVLFANDAFYIAFASRDMAAMKELWSRDDAITCVHPGRNPLVGYDEVMASWEAILSGDASPEIICLHARAHVVGDTAVVVCHEEIGGAYLVATNVFVRQDGGWKVVHHQAGPAPAPDEDGEEPPPRMQ